MKILTSCARALTLIGFCLLGWSAPSFSSGDTAKTTIFFYSSETNIDNFKSLKMEFDSYLAQFGAYEFQPFSEKQTFEQQIGQHPNCLLLLSSWHYDTIRDDFRLVPLLIGSRKGRTHQKRFLVAGSEHVTLETLRSGQLASAGSIQYTQTLLNDMLGQPEEVENLRILTVPKDIDALMSLGFGVAKAAISTDYSLETLAQMNPVLHKKLKIIAESQETRLLLLAAPEQHKGTAQEVVAIFQGMKADRQGEKRLRMLGLDGWRNIDTNDATDSEN